MVSYKKAALWFLISVGIASLSAVCWTQLQQTATTTNTSLITGILNGIHTLFISIITITLFIVAPLTALYSLFCLIVATAKPKALSNEPIHSTASPVEMIVLPEAESPEPEIYNVTHLEPTSHTNPTSTLYLEASQTYLSHSS